MKAIWKYVLDEGSRVNAIEMPEGARILCVQTQQGRGAIWVVADPDSPMETRVFEIFGTGWNIEDGAYNYIGTFKSDRLCGIFSKDQSR